MTKWELAKYLIDAKKEIDSIMYISRNIEDLRHLNIKENIDKKVNNFNINCVVVLDKSINRTTLKMLKDNDEIIKKLYYERDKNSAHKDDDYIPTQFDSIGLIIKQMKDTINHIRIVCNEKLPEVLTLDFVEYDKTYFRLINNINASKEDAINNEKYIKSDFLNKEVKEFNVINDLEELKLISEEAKKTSAITIDNGLTFEEGLQIRQDKCILINITFNQNLWINLSEENYKNIKELEKFGVFNKFGQINEDKAFEYFQNYIESNEE